MRIDHAALYVQDLEKAKQFFVTYFNACCNAGYYNPKTGLRTYFLTFTDEPGGCRLELMSRPGMSEQPKEQLRTGYTHLAFSLGSREQVDQLTARLQADGYKVLSGPRVTGDGYYESCVLGPEDNQIELVA